MTILGDPIFAKNPDGSLKSRIGTIFFRTPGSASTHVNRASDGSRNSSRSSAPMPRFSSRRSTIGCNFTAGILPNPRRYANGEVRA